MNDNPRNWSDDEIRYYFDSHPNLRMQHLARMTGKSMYELKRILMPGRKASAERVASRFMEAYRSDQVKGSGGLIFSWGGHREGLAIRTEAKDPYGQVYSSTLTSMQSGKLALKALGRMWEDPKIRREILSKRKPYEVTEFIDRKIAEMGVRGRLRWHTKHYPD